MLSNSVLDDSNQKGSSKQQNIWRDLNKAKDTGNSDSKATEAEGGTSLRASPPCASQALCKCLHFMPLLLNLLLFPTPWGFLPPFSGCLCLCAWVILLLMSTWLLPSKSSLPWHSLLPFSLSLNLFIYIYYQLGILYVFIKHKFPLKVNSHHEQNKTVKKPNTISYFYRQWDPGWLSALISINMSMQPNGM